LGFSGWAGSARDPKVKFVCQPILPISLNTMKLNFVNRNLCNSSQALQRIFVCNFGALTARDMFQKAFKRECFFFCRRSLVFIKFLGYPGAFRLGNFSFKQLLSDFVFSEKGFGLFQIIFYVIELFVKKH
jgi:hypothetical protein